MATEGKVQAEQAHAKPGSTHEQAPSRVIIEGVRPEIDGGRFPIKRTVGEEVVVTADIFAEGHDVLAAVVQHRPRRGRRVVRGADDARWSTTAGPAGSPSSAEGRHEYTVEAWVDRFASWRTRARQEVGGRAGRRQRAARRGRARPRGGRPGRRGRTPTGSATGPSSSAAAATRPTAGRTRRSTPSWPTVMARHPDRSRRLDLRPDPRRHGRARAGPLRRLVRDVPPVVLARARPARHVPGRRGAAALRRRRWGSTSSTCRRSTRSAGAFRKGPNNTLTPGPDDPGSPWAIGGPEGGHKAIHPELGTLDDFDRLVAAAQRAGHRDRAGHRLPVLARPPLRPRAPRVVPAPARRHDQVRREPAQEVPGHLPDRLRVRRLAGPLGRAPRRLPLLGRPRRQRSSGSTTRTPSRSGSGTG